ncbi:MAG TPA: hypothetical protein VIM94_08940 [Salegentibacter sp.]|uniref:hypothetical protein n=1 Tax=Salegentibacter sp. TaxID=1903072 RepID=UPI002F934B88
MSLLPGTNKVILYLAFCILLTGCVKDIDLDQAEKISLSPDLDVDLLIYDISEEYFFRSENNVFQPVIRDTVRLEFLDDDYIQKDLTEVEFYFRHINTFPQGFSHTIKFLSDAGREQILIQYEVAPGNSNNPVTTDYTEIIEENRINLIRNSIQMVVELEAHPNSKEFKGKLEFASTGLFKFDF